MTYDDQLELDLLVMLARDVAATPDSSDEAIAFFRHLAESFVGTREEFLSHVRSHAAAWFPSVGERPRWLQSENWLWGRDGRPMTFLGQIDVPEKARAFPCDSAVYVFVDQSTGELHTVLQRS